MHWYKCALSHKSYIGVKCVKLLSVRNLHQTLNRDMPPKTWTRRKRSETFHNKFCGCCQRLLETARKLRLAKSLCIVFNKGIFYYVLFPLVLPFTLFWLIFSQVWLYSFPLLFSHSKVRTNLLSQEVKDEDKEIMEVQERRMWQRKRR